MIRLRSIYCETFGLFHRFNFLLAALEVGMCDKQHLSTTGSGIAAATQPTGSGGTGGPLCKRLLGVKGFSDKQNDVVFCGHMSKQPEQNVVFFGGDVQVCFVFIYKEFMQFSSLTFIVEFICNAHLFQ